MFGRVLKCLGEFSAWESFGALKRVLESLGEFWSAWESYGAFGRVLERLGEFWSVWESFGAFGMVVIENRVHPGNFRKSGPPW